MVKPGTRPKRQKWDLGDIFTIPVSRDLGVDMDGEDVFLGQVVGIIPEIRKYNFLGMFFDATEPSQIAISEERERRMLAVQIVTAPFLISGEWRIVGSSSPEIPIRELHVEDFWENPVGHRMIGAGIIKDFLAACRGHIPWNCNWKDDYFDTILSKWVKRPTAAYMIDKKIR